MTFLGCAAAALSLFGTVDALAQDAAGDAAGQAAEQADAEQMRLLREELDYSTALIYAGLPDFAEDVLKAAKARWPEADTLAFAIEIRGMLALGKYDEAEKKIASLPDRNSAKYWAARLEVANNYFYSGKRDDSKKIYQDFFAAADRFLKGKNPDKALVEIARTARYQYGRLRQDAGDLAGAAGEFDTLLGMLNPRVSEDDDITWCNVATEAADIYLRLASEGGKQSKDFLGRAKKHIDKLLWRQDRPLYFGRAIAMKAYFELLNGSVEKAQTVVNDYKEQLQAIHEQLEKADPTGSEGLLAQSPMPQCRYLMAEKYWREAQNEFKKPKRDDEKIKSLLFGAKKKSGRGRDGQGAFNNAVNVYLRYPQSIWAPKAEKLQGEIAKFAQEKYGAKIQTHETPEQRERVIDEQFKRANDKFNEGKYAEAEAGFRDALANYPEIKRSIDAVECIANGYLKRLEGEGDGADADRETKTFWRLEADAVEGYLSERFAGHSDKEVMSAAGDAVLRLAAKEKERENANRALGATNRSVRLYLDFANNYTRHAMAAQMAYATGAGLQRQAIPKDPAEAPDAKTRDALLDAALEFYVCVTNRYPKSEYNSFALGQMSTCYERLGDQKLATAALSQYVASIDEKKKPLMKIGADMNLQTRKLKAGLLALEALDGILKPEEREAAKKEAVAEILDAATGYLAVSKKAREYLSKPKFSKEEKAKFAAVAESALYFAGDAYNRVPGTDGELAQYRAKAAEIFAECIKVAPKGSQAPLAYEKLGRIYSQLGKIDDSRNALKELRDKFPESASAKRAIPQLARALVEYSRTIQEPAKKEKLIAEVRDIYSDMLSNKDGKYSAHDFVSAGNMLLEASSYDTALLAYQKAEKVAETAKSKRYLADARIGQARVALESGDIPYARATLDAFLDDESLRGVTSVVSAYDLMIKVAMRQAEKESDAAKRRRFFGDAIGAAKNLRGYWSRTNSRNEKKVRAEREKSGKGDPEAPVEPIVPLEKIDAVTVRLAGIYVDQMNIERGKGNAAGSDKALLSASTVLDTLVANYRLAAQALKAETDEREATRKRQAFARSKANFEEALYLDIEVLGQINQGDGRQLDEIAALCREYLEYFPDAAKEHVDHVKHILEDAYERGASKTSTAPIAAKPEAAQAPAADEDAGEKAEADASAEAAGPAGEDAEEPGSADGAEGEEPAGGEEPAEGEAAAE
ncbi:MAG: hypothetical protein K6F50_05385 [Kiritimatiellae bacterium]|nr:hypothetical protein [Kiritimatiellia bacterium]